jgi:annexin A13
VSLFVCANFLLQGVGTREKELISVLCNRTEAQLQVLRLAFEAKQGKNLVKLISSETTGLVEKAFEYIVSNSAEVRASFVRDSVKGVGTEEASLIDSLCTATPREIAFTREAYNKDAIIKYLSPFRCFGFWVLFRFDTKIKLESAGDVQAIFEANLDSKRPESGIDMSTMEDDCVTFIKKTEGQTGTDIRYLAKLIATRSREHLNALHIQVAK